jgi:hypothetical protein
VVTGFCILGGQLNPWTIGPGCVSTIPGVAKVNGVKVNGTPNPMTVSDAVNNGMGVACTYKPVNGIINGNVTPGTSLAAAGADGGPGQRGNLAAVSHSRSG